MEIIILKHVSYIKGKEKISFFSKEIGKKYLESKDLSFMDFTKQTSIISFDFVNIIESVPINDNIIFIDIINLKRQLVGRSKNEFKSKEKPWLIWNMINELKPEASSDLAKFQENIEKTKAIFLGIMPSSFDASHIYSFLLNCIETIYLNLKKDLSTSIEKERFEQFECQLNNVLFETNKNGIRIDRKKVREHIHNVNIELYEIKNKLQLEFGVFSLFDYENILKIICKEFKWFKEIKVNSKEFWGAISLQKDNSKFVNLLYLEKKLSKDKTILTRIGSLDTDYIYPVFDYFGTVTGRILVSAPSLQQLNKKYRDIIIPKSKMELVYIDYCQFEAGILASEANETKLIEMYNDNDIYTEISTKLGKEKVSRDLAKKLFFYYCYGMSKERILLYSGKDLNIFFNEFNNLEIYEKQIEEGFFKDGYVETTLGNRRYKSLNNIENIKEGWLISQRIQGIASLILKEVIIQISKENKEIEFLLPMHDAILYQIPKSKIEELTIIIEKTFKSVFKRHCPSLNPKVSNKKFFEIQ